MATVCYFRVEQRWDFLNPIATRDRSRRDSGNGMDQAAGREWTRVRSCKSADTGCRRNAFLPAGTMASVTGWRSRLECMCLVSSHAHRRGS